MSTLGRQEIILENNFTYISAEKARAFELRHSDIIRPRSVMEVGSLEELLPGECNASEVSVMVRYFSSEKFMPVCHLPYIKF